MMKEQSRIPATSHHDGGQVTNSELSLDQVKAKIQTRLEVEQRDAPDTFSSALMASLEPRRAYKREGEFKKPNIKHARFKMKVFFLNGTDTIEVSWEREGTKEKPKTIDEWLALDDLINLVRNPEKWADLFKAAHIYISKEDNPLVSGHTYNDKIISIYPDGFKCYYNFDYKLVTKGIYTYNEVDWFTWCKIG